MKTRMLVTACVVSLVLCASRVRAADEKPVDLLRLTTAAIERTSLTGVATGDFKALTDGDSTTRLVLDVSSDETVTVVYGFDGATVSPERLAVAIPSATKEASPPERIDLLVSMVSPHAGFQSVRTEALKPSPKPQEFGFTPVGAKWIMLRFTPARGGGRMLLGDVTILGYEGPPVSRYKFKESPAKALDVLQRLQKNASLKVEISRDEADLFDDVTDGKLDRWSFGEAALLASGVHDAAKRKQYVARLDMLEVEAKKAVGNAKSPFDRGAALLKYLHAGPMTKGYSAKQTDVSTILDAGTFNCVSSATLYNILGKRLGLDVRAIEVPHHAFSIVYDGPNHADVETTTAGGFNPARDKAAQEAFTKLTGFAYIPDSNRDERREVGEAGLIAIVYYNHGVGLTEEKQYHEALLAYFRAMSLDREFDSAVKNALAVLANWGVALSREKKFEEALNVVATGLALAPNDAALVNNHKAAWSEWADSLIKAGQSDEALAVLRRAAEAVPDGNFVRMQSWVFIRPGEEFAKSGQWEQALAVVAPGLKKLDSDPRRELAEWGRGLYHRWAESEQKKGRFAQAIDVLEKGLKESPSDKQFPGHLAYVVQEWGRSAYAKDGAAAAEKIMSDVLERFPQSADVKRVTKGHSQRVVKDLIGKRQFDEALATAERSGKLLKDDELAQDLSRAVYDDQAEALIAKSDWQGAIDVYAKGLARFPGDKHLDNNWRATWDNWAQSYSKMKDWKSALEVYEKAVKQLPDAKGAENNIKFLLQEWARDSYSRDGTEASVKVLTGQLERFSALKGVRDVGRSHIQRIVQDLARQAKYDDALAAAQAGKALLKDEAELGEVSAGVYDTWAGEHRNKKDWQRATDVYAQGLKKFPKERRLEQNAVAAWYQWAKTYMDSKDWNGAIKVYEKALEQFPTNGTLKNNLKFCQQQLDKEKP